ncbi:hypothetical protein ALC56_08307, partial [Trachymyrmex septentrionalis]
VYKINCKDCNASYVGQTKRKLITRVTEHKSNLHKGPNFYSVITEHALHHSHKINWDNTEVLDEERYFNKRLISEIINIKQQTNLNLQKDTDSLDHTYNDILNKCK